jgi:selenocysteine lyase/cysteine desulfurase
MNKRSFLRHASLLGTFGLFSPFKLQAWINEHHRCSADELAADEEFWRGIRKGYRLKSDFINLENGYYCILPEETLEHQIKHIREVNYQGAYYMRTVQFDDKKRVASRLAALAGCQTNELVITRNTTESLDMIIGGQDWKPGDEAVMAEQDYGAMLDMFKLVARRHGVVNKIVSLPLNPSSDEEIVNLYANTITPKTKLLMICHMVNITGQILPVKKICEMAHSKGVEVMVDGAHAFAHIRYRIDELNCDYYGASLHKWLSVPLGAGILYVKKDKIQKVWPLLAAGEKSMDDITRLNHVGTHPVHTTLAIDNAIDYYEMLGAERKEKRLRYLQNYWTNQVRHLPHIILNTPTDHTRSCGIANVGVKSMTPAALAETLLKKYGVYTVAIDGAGVHGCRITPNLYTSTAELDAFVRALRELG